MIRTIPPNTLAKTKLGAIIKQIWATVLFIAITSCGQDKRDQRIKADIYSKAKDDVNFAGVAYSVTDGIVKLSGSCASKDSRESVLRTVKSIQIIDSVENRLSISAVTLPKHYAVKRRLDSILAAYPTTQLRMTDTNILMEGKINRSDMARLSAAIEKIRPENLVTNISITP